MFCPKCGTALPEQSQYCNMCGTAIAADTTYYPVDPRGSYANAGSYPVHPQSVAPPQKARSKTPLIVLGALALVILAVLAALFLARGCTVAESGSPKGVVLNATQAVLELDFEKALSYYPDEMVDHLVEQTGLSSREALVGAVNEGIHYSDKQLGLLGIDIREVLANADYRVTGSTKFTDEELSELKAHWNSIKPGFGDSFQDAAAVTLELSGKVEVFGHSISLSDYIGALPQIVTTVKIENTWYLLDTSLTDLLKF